MGTRRGFSREFKLEAVRLVKERGVTAAQAARDVDVHENVLRKWVREPTPGGLGNWNVPGSHCGQPPGTPPHEGQDESRPPLNPYGGAAGHRAAQPDVPP